MNVIKKYIILINATLFLLFSNSVLALDFITDTNHVSCNGGSDGSIVVRLTVTGTTPYTYQLWDDLPFFLGGSGSVLQQVVHNADTAYFGGLSASSTYYLWVFDNIGSNKGQFNPLTEPSALSAPTITLISGLTCYDSEDAVLEANITGGTEPYSYLWEGGNAEGMTTKQVSGLGLGIYKVYVDDANGCGPEEATFFYGPTHPSVPDDITISSVDTTPTCIGTNNGILQINASGGTPDLDYAIVNTSITDSTFQEGNNFATLGAATYNTWVIDNNGCTKQGPNGIISSVIAPVADASTDITTCTGMAVITMTGATATGTYSGTPTWSGGVGLGTWSQNADPALATFTPTTSSGSFTATLTLTGIYGCVDGTDTRVITWGTQPVADASNDINSCTGMAAISMTGATASGTYSGTPTWSGGGGLGTWSQNADPALATFTPTTASGSFTATLTLTGTNGCVDATDTRVISWATQPVADASTDITTCTGMAIITMTGATASGSYSGTPAWSGGGGLGTWTQNADPALATFTPTTSSGSFTATLTLTGINGCADGTDTRLISWGTQPVADASTDITTCTGVAAITMTGASATGTYSGTPTWSGGGGLGTWTQNADPALATFTPTTSSGSFTATLTLTGTNGCVDDSDTRVITWGTQPVADASNDINSCTGLAAITMTGATATGTYSGTPTWSGGGGLGTWTQNADPSLATFTPTTSSGSFTATLTLTGTNGCIDATDTRVISWATQPVADASTDITTCTGMAVITMTGATATGTYSGTPTWIGGGGLGTWSQNADPALATFTPTTSSGSFTATLTLTGINGCADGTDTRVITWGTQPVADASTDITSCTGMTAITMTGATATGTYSGTPTWSGGGGLGTWSQNADPALSTFTPTTSSGSFTATLTLTGTNGCVDDTDTRVISWSTQPVADASTDINSCTGLAAIAMTGATASGTYSGTPTWSGGGGLGTWIQNADPALATFTPTTSSGSFTATLTLTGINGCVDGTDTRVISWGTQPVANASTDITTCTGLVAITMTGATATGTYSGTPTWSGGGGLGTWSQNADPALATFTPTTSSGSFTATLTLTGINGCVDGTDTRIITWGTQPVADASTDLTSCTGMAAIAMTGATATGTYSGTPTWSGGGGLGTWSQNADPALATFTPTTSSGSFTATLTLTGTNGCVDDTDTRIITWGTQPVADAATDINSCTGLAVITMTGATASGTYSGTPTWSGGGGLGTWVQNADPAIATFTPTTSSGSFTATLTLTGINGCVDGTDTRVISWGTQPIADASTDITSCSGLAAITMTGATATGTYSGTPTWSGGGGLGIWTQNADPALATFTPTTASGSFTATITLIGINGCVDATDTRVVSWSTQPVADAGTDITTCTGLAAINMTGATASGTYSGTPTWSGGGGLGTWTQNADPALATFTPTTPSGSFTATLTLTGTNGCVDDTDTRIISWGTQPIADASTDITTCTGLAAITMTGATATGTYSGTPTWSGGGGLGTWAQNADPALATFTPTTPSGSFTATLTLTGTNGCVDATDTRIISWGTQPIADASTDITSCTGLAAINMTGATATGTYSGTPTWSGGGGLGTWTQNADPALATFTPTTPSGSFTATLTLTGTNGCIDATDTRIISWGTQPIADASTDITSCTGLAAINMTGATASGTYSGTPTWSGGGGLGTWTQNADPALATFTPTAPSGTFTATLTLTGTNGCVDATDTRIISWGTQPVADAGTDITTCTGVAAINMTGATASGTYSGTPTWSGGSGLGTWAQNADPAVATFTPTSPSGSFTATLTLTGINGCVDGTDTRVITWGTQPTAIAGLDINTCTGLTTISMTGAFASGTFSGTPTWSGGAGLGTWAQNADPALATFTPTTPSGSFTATLTLTGTNGCVDDIDTRVITWTIPPTADAGPDDAICYDSAYTIPSADTTYSSSILWSNPFGDGLFDDDTQINPVYTPGNIDRANGSVELVLEAFGIGGCPSVTDTMVLTIAPQLEVAVGTPPPFLIGTNTEIEVCLTTNDHAVIQDLGYYLMAPDGVTTMPLKVGPMEYDYFGICNFGSDVTDLCFTTELPLSDTLDVCSEPTPLTGNFAATGDWSTFYGMNPAEGGWAVMVKDTANNRGGIDGAITNASITFADTATATGLLEQLIFESGSIADSIIELANTTVILPRKLTVSCNGLCDAEAIVNVIGGTAPYNTYNWDKPPFSSNALGDSVILCADTFQVTVTDVLGCSGSTIVEVVSPPAIVINEEYHTDSLQCNGDSTGVIVVKASYAGPGDLDYVLTQTNDTLFSADSGSFNNLPAGNYTVEIWNASGCQIDTTLRISEPEPINFDTAYVDQQVFCAGDTIGRIVAVAEGGRPPYSYILTPLNIVNDSGIFNNLPADYTYFVRVTDQFSCDTITSGKLIVGTPDILVLDTIISPIASCSDDSVNLTVTVSGGISPYEVHVIQGIDTTTVITTDGTAVIPKIAGIYNIVVEDSANCSIDSIGHVIDGPPAPLTATFDTTNVTICYNALNGAIKVNAAGGWGNYRFAIDTNDYQLDSTFNGLGKGTYFIRIRDSISPSVICIKQFSVYVGGPSLDLNITHTDGIADTLGTIRVAPTGDFPPFELWFSDVWEDEADRTYFGSFNVGEDTTFVDLGPGLYYISARDNNGCVRDETQYVDMDRLDIDIAVVDPPCNYGSAVTVIRINIHEGDEPFTVVDSNLTTGEVTTAIFTDIFPPPTETVQIGVDSGDHYIRITDDNKLFYDTSYTAVVPNEFYIDTVLITPKSCSGYALDTTPTWDGRAEVITFGGTGDKRYRIDVFNPGGEDIIGYRRADTNVFTDLGQYQWHCALVFDDNGCWDSVSYKDIRIMYPRYVQESYLYQDTTVCKYNQLPLYAGRSYDWESPDTDNPVEFPITANWRPEELFSEVVGTTTTARIKDDTTVIHMRFIDEAHGCMQLDSVQITLHDTVGVRFNLESSPRYGYDSTTQRILATDGSQIVVLLNENYRFTAVEEELLENEVLGAMLDTNDYLNNGPHERIIFAEGDSMLFYALKVTGIGCVELDTLRIGVRTILEKDSVYTVFTPNGDGFNDTWTIPNAHLYSDVEVEIFNRWGQLVYRRRGYGTSTDYEWDGTSMKSGKPLPIGTYYYVIKPNDGETEPITGTVTILR